MEIGLKCMLMCRSIYIWRAKREKVLVTFSLALKEGKTMTPLSYHQVVRRVYNYKQVNKFTTIMRITPFREKTINHFCNTIFLFSKSKKATSSVKDC